jgi:hypothetical protein
MRIPRSRVHGTMRTIVRRRSSLYDVARPLNQGQTARFGESEAATNTITDVSMWLFEPNEVNIDTEYGDRLGGDLQGLALPSADIEVHDHVTHGADSYEVERIMHLPDNDDQQLKMFSLQKRTND